MRELEEQARRHGSGSPEFERALETLLELWDEFSFLDPSDPELALDLRLAAGDCARLVAELDTLERLPQGWTRLAILARAREFLPLGLEPYPREVRAYLELDFIEESAGSGDLEGALRLGALAREPLADVPQALAELRILDSDHALALGRFNEATSSIQAARELLGRLESGQTPRSYVPIYADVVEGSILVALGLPDRAVHFHEQCERALERGDSPESEGLVVSLGTELALARDDFDWIERTLKPRLESGGIAGDPPEWVQTRWLDVEIANARAALLGGEGLEAARDALRSRLGSGPLRNPMHMGGPLALAELEFALDDADSALARIERLEADLDAILSPEARLPRQVLAELRGRIHLGRGSTAAELEDVHGELERGFGDLLDAWDNAPHREGGVGFLLFDRRSSHLVTLIRVTLALDPGISGARRALEYVLEADARSTLVRRLGAARVGADEIQAELAPADGGILHIVPSPFGSLLLAITPGDIQVHEAADVRSLREWNLRWCAEWLEEDSDPGAAADSEAGRELREGLLSSELQAEIKRWSTLIVVGNEALNFVPFEALPPIRPGTSALGLSHAIGYLPGLAVGTHLARKRASQGEAVAGTPVQFVVGLGEVSGTAGRVLPALPWRDSDLEVLRGDWGDPLVELLSEASKARAAVLTAGSSGVHLLEIVAHGVRERELERGQGLAFDDRSKVFPEDLDGVRTPPLVALAVCEVGRGAVRVGDEGASHLGGAFLASGTRAVLISRQDLSFEASIALLGAFNRSLSQGESVSRALLAARQEMSRNPRWAHPRYYALLHAYGDGELRAPTRLLAPVLGSRFPRLLLVGAVLAVGVVGWLMYRRSGAGGPRSV